MLKRIMSNPDDGSMKKESKLTKKSAGHAAIGNGQQQRNCNDEETNNLAAVATGSDGQDATVPGQFETCPDVPLGSITRRVSNTSSNSSMLSDEGVETDGEGRRLGRSAMADPEPTSEDNIHPGALQSFESKSSSKTGSSYASSSRTGASHGAGKDWGWFDDIHDSHGHASTPLNSSSDLKKVPAVDRAYRTIIGSKKSVKSEKKKRGGLLHFSDALPKHLEAIVDMPKEPTSMAVTAPQYVLEESLSSQKLWKETAGNRPPQPVDERAFYEQIWAQNFIRSQVTYDMPVEVLTATSPISLSPFAEGTFEDNSGMTNYNIATPFNPATATAKQYEESGPMDSATIKAAEAAAAEASLRISGTAGAANYYKTKSFGPHHPQHTLVNQKVKGSESEGDLTVAVRGDNVFGTTVSKSFPRPGDRGGVDTVSISISSYRVVDSKKHGKYAQFLVVYCEGSFRDTVGVWKRFSDFDELSREVTFGHESCAYQSCSSTLGKIHPISENLSSEREDNDVEYLPNAITSWRLLKKRQRWFRCLDAGYLSLKVFLLERFLHDILFESSSPRILRKFVGVTHQPSSTSTIHIPNE